MVLYNNKVFQVSAVQCRDDVSLSCQKPGWSEYRQNMILLPFFPRLRAKVTILSIKWIIWVGQSVLLNLSLQQISKTINYKSTIMKTTFTALGLSLLFILAGCAGKQQPAKDNFIQDNIDNAVAQHTLQTDIIEKSVLPRQHVAHLRTDG